MRLAAVKPPLLLYMSVVISVDKTRDGSKFFKYLFMFKIRANTY